MNDQSETERSSTVGHWFGLDRLRLTQDDQAIDVTVGPGSHWDRSHLRRLRQSGDLPGMVPIIDSDFSADGKPFAVTPVVDAPTLSDLLNQGGLSWTDGAGITEAAARAIHEAHLRGLFHGALSPDDIHVIGDDVALAGVGLGLGGRVPADRATWAAPEVRDGADPTERSDVYSLGKVLEASLGDAIDTAPRSIRRLIMWSSSDTPEARPPSAMEFASILAEGLGEDRHTYGPAFISTAGLSDLASRASSAVSGHTPSDTARATASSSSGAMGAVAAGAAGAALGAGAGMLAGREADEPAGEGYSVAEAAPAEPVAAAAATPAEVIPASAVRAEPAEELVSASPGMGGPRTEAINEYTVPAAAQTIDLDEIYLPKKQRSRAGLMVSGILLLGLAGIAYGIFSSSGSSSTGSETSGTPAGQTSVTTSVTTNTTEAVATTPVTEAATTAPTAAPTTPTTAAPTTATTAAPTTVTTAAPTTVTTAAPTTAATAAPTTAAAVAPTTAATVAPPTTASTPTTAPVSVTAGAATPSSLVNTGGPIPSKDAAIQILHGVPKTPVDLYVNGKSLATNFTTGSIAGPVKLAPGNYDVALYAAIPNAPKDASARTDAAVLAKSITVGTDPATVVAYVGQDGKPAVGAFTERFGTLPAGKSRILVRHLMSFGPAEVFLNGKSIGTLKPGDEASADLAAGSALVELKGPDGTVVYKATVKVPAGELASFTAIGSPGDKSAELMLQRFTGLQAAPASVPTGDSGLLGLGEDQTGLRLVYGVMILLALSGGFVLVRRQRTLS